MAKICAKGISSIGSEILYAPTRIKQKKKNDLLNWNTVPEFLKDNEFIRSGYRANSSFSNALKSLFQIHNETGNVWTHLIGFLLFLSLTCYMICFGPRSYIVRHEPLEGIWSSVQNNLHSFSDQIGEGVNTLQYKMQIHTSLLRQELRQSLIALHTNLEIKAIALKSQLHQHLDVAKHVLNKNLVNLSQNLHKSYHSLTDNVHLFQRKMEYMTGNLNSKISIARCNLENSYITLQDNLHNLQDNVSDNLGGIKHSVLKSFSHLYDNLYHLQVIINEHYPILLFGNEHDNFKNNATQCPTTLDMDIQNTYFPISLSPVVKWPIYLFMSGAMVCMFASSSAHLFGCCSKHVLSWMLKVDYVGISFLIITSFYPPVYYGFMCHKPWLFFYLTVISTLGLIVIIVSLSNKFQTNQYRIVRAILFSSLGLCGTFPMLHLLFIYQNIPIFVTATLYEAAMGISYLTGAILYAIRIPERFKPGAFDVIFHSHQIFHTSVVLGAYIHLQATLLLWEWRESSWGCSEFI